MLCAPVGVDFSLVGGRVVVDQGRLMGVDLEPLIERHNRLAEELAAG